MALTDSIFNKGKVKCMKLHLENILHFVKELITWFVVCLIQPGPQGHLCSCSRWTASHKKICFPWTVLRKGNRYPGDEVAPDPISRRHAFDSHENVIYGKLPFALIKRNRIALHSFEANWLILKFAIHHHENKNVKELTLCESEVKATVQEMVVVGHSSSSLNLVSRHLKLHNIFEMAIWQSKILDPCFLSCLLNRRDQIPLLLFNVHLKGL